MTDKDRPASAVAALMPGFSAEELREMRDLQAEYEELYDEFEAGLAEIVGPAAANTITTIFKLFHRIKALELMLAKGRPEIALLGQEVVTELAQEELPAALEAYRREKKARTTIVGPDGGFLA